MNRAKPMKHLLVPALISVALTACAPDPTSDLVEYTKQVKSQQKAKIEPLPEFEPFESFEYAAFDLRDPFTVPDDELDRIEVDETWIAGRRATNA